MLRLLKDLPAGFEADVEMLKRAADLDKMYIPARYPNGFDSGAPMDYFGKEDAERAIEDARVIIDYARSKIHR